VIVTTGAAPRVTVVIPIFNAEAFLAETIESVLGQTYVDWEAILVDDGSTDSSRAIADEYAGSNPERIRVAQHERRANRGACASRNLAIRLATGEFIALLDADDVWLPEKLEEQVAILDANPAAGMVYGHSRYWQSWDRLADPLAVDHTPPLGVATDRVYPPKALNLLLYPLAKMISPCPSDLLLRKELVVRIEGFEEEFHHDLQLYEDQAFLSKVYLHASVFVSCKTWDLYRLHPDSCDARVIGSGQYEEVRRYFLDWFEAYLRRIGEHNPAIQAALRDALFPYRHPWLHRFAASDAGRRIRATRDRFRLPSEKPKGAAG
jgi:glycosyltransferase involved in cell wall biosynthesis